MPSRSGDVGLLGWSWWLLDLDGGVGICGGVRVLGGAGVVVWYVLCCWLVSYVSRKHLE